MLRPQCSHTSQVAVRETPAEKYEQWAKVFWREVVREIPRSSIRRQLKSGCCTVQTVGSFLSNSRQRERASSFGKCTWCPFLYLTRNSTVLSPQGSVKEMLNLSQQEYVHRIDELNNQLISAWDQDQRVKALKIAIQVITLSQVLFPKRQLLLTRKMYIYRPSPERCRLSSLPCSVPSCWLTSL